MEPFKISDIQELFAADLERFVVVSREQLARLLAEDPAPPGALDEVIRQAHTLKGLAATVQAWGLSRWGEDLETLAELAGTFLVTDRDRADTIFNFFLQHLNDWHVMNQFTLADLLPQAWEHYQGLRQLMEVAWRDYLRPLDPALSPTGANPIPPPTVARPATLAVLPPKLRRRSETNASPAGPDANAALAGSGTSPTSTSASSAGPDQEGVSTEAASFRQAPLTGAILPHVAPPLLKRHARNASSTSVPSAPAALSTDNAHAPSEIAASPADSTAPVFADEARATPTPTPEPPAEVFHPEADAEMLRMLGQEVSGYLDELTSTLLVLAQNLQAEPAWQKTRRLFHTIKGTAATFNLDRVSAPAQAAEAQCIAATEDAHARTPAAFECCLSHAQAVAGALQLSFKVEGLRAALEAAGAAPVRAEAAPAAEAAFDAEMANFFVQDAGDQIAAIEQAVLRWEKGENAAEQIWAAQRGFHTLKGAANSIGLRAVADSVHEAESFLEGVAAGGAVGSPSLFSFLLNCVDQVRQYLRELGANRSHPWLFDWTNALRVLGDPTTASDSQTSASDPAVILPKSAPGNQSPEEEHTLRIEAARLYQVMNLIGEMVFDRARLEKKIDQLSSLHGALAERNGALTGSIQTFQQQFEFNLLQDRAAAGLDADPAGRPDSGASGAATSETSDGEFSEVEFDRYDQFNILARSLIEISHDIEQLNGDVVSCLESFGAENARFRQSSRHLQSQVTSLSLVPVNTLFPRLQRAFRDATTVDQKDAELILEGEDALLDKVVIDKIYAPLLHLLRNAVAHGIEDPATRERLKKAPRGKVTLTTAQQSNQIVITIADDGAGVRAEAVRARAIDKGWLTAEAPPLTPAQVVNYIFQPGFSTARKVTSVSGRGVGLDVVRKEIEALNGSVELRYEPDQGSTWTLRLPLTLSISEAILAEVSGIVFAFPINFVLSGIILDEPITRSEEGSEQYQVGEEFLPMVRLAEVLRLPGRSTSSNGLIVCVGDRRAIVVVERVLTRQEIVVKQLDSLTAKHPLLNGATLDAEGRVIPILNLPMLLKFSERSCIAPAVEAAPASAVAEGVLKPFRVLIVDDSLSVRKVQERLLHDLGCLVVGASDGLQALEKLREGPFDFVFTDLEMPRLNGYELIAEIRGNPAWAALPIVVISSRSGDKYITKAMSSGAMSFLSKPFTQPQLEKVLRFYAGWDAKTRTRGTRVFLSAETTLDRAGNPEPDAVSF